MSTIDLSRYDTDKSEDYIAAYEREFGHLFDKPISLLELGVQRGGSMLLWRDMFPNGQIAGLDLNQITVPDKTGRVHVYRGFQQDPEILDRIAEEVAPDGFDIVVDDASHVGIYTLASFEHLFPRHLKPGGVYVLDDWSIAYDSDWADGRRYKPPSKVKAPTDARDFRLRIRTAARPIASAIQRRSPAMRKRLERAYMRAEGTVVQKRFPSHDYGMAGVIKHLVDTCGVEGLGQKGDFPISRMSIKPNQVFVHRAD